MLIAPAGFGVQPFGTSSLGVGYRDINLTIGAVRSRTLTASLGDLVDFTSTERRFQTIPVTAADADGTPVTLTEVKVAVLPPRAAPDGATTWTAGNYANGELTVLLAGPDADPSGAIAIPRGGADLWVRVDDSPEIIAAKVGRVTVQ